MSSILLLGSPPQDSAPQAADSTYRDATGQRKPHEIKIESYFPVERGSMVMAVFVLHRPLCSLCA